MVALPVLLLTLSEELCLGWLWFITHPGSQSWTSFHLRAVSELGLALAALQLDLGSFPQPNSPLPQISDKRFFHLCHMICPANLNYPALRGIFSSVFSLSDSRKTETFWPFFLCLTYICMLPSYLVCLPKQLHIFLLLFLTIFWTKYLFSHVKSDVGFK